MIAQKNLDAVGSQVAAIFRAERERQKLSMNGVAERAGLSQSMVSLVEREVRKPTLETLLRISTALDLELSDVLQRAQRAAHLKAT
ncbi:helix-turn-helix transcriptional regulator [Opitutus sp. GAS368]|uniref:helix-turn-helix domain-containing protein n=1 Tax=Opitutus sp. GAS368 TaxID=1882749 RepID=UPI00087BE6E5|nr:helix-turn-helix transcriptional regulator [Opitutus sp. GAS368]SDS02509.1 Helix-turn-helix [Opitutus sp. GAS368]